MKTIEEEIKQKKFSNIYAKTDVNFLFTSGWIENEIARFFKPFGISAQQFNVLRILRGQHPNPVMLNQITERMIDKMSNATRLVDKLQKKEFVTRDVCMHSKRQVDIHITPNGLTLLENIDKMMFQQTPARYLNLTDEELELLNTILNKIRN